MLKRLIHLLCLPAGSTRTQHPASLARHNMNTMKYGCVDFCEHFFFYVNFHIQYKLARRFIFYSGCLILFCGHIFNDTIVGFFLCLCIVVAPPFNVSGKHAVMSGGGVGSRPAERAQTGGGEVNRQ